ncbi:MAG TPA: hypothetical protein VFW83_00495 [Bryobacteraceae bacterium]|nr:hypothetical protein [Bryobacteraceae bacterium]
MVEVRPVPGSTILGTAKGAFVNAFALADNQRNYEKAVKRALRRLALVAFEFEDVESFFTRTSRQDLGERLYEIAEETRLSGEVCFDDFHTYAALDA